VTLTAAKMAEANGEGLILRFNEIKGQTTNVEVDLGWFAPSSVTETDLVENDKGPVKIDGGRIAFTIQPFGFKTFRLTRGAAPPATAGVTATFDASGCLVTWRDQPDAACFEIFRSTRADFTPGTGSYVATVSASHYYDPTVRAGLTRSYHYKVRAAAAGRKGGFSAAAEAVPGLAADTTAPSVPVLTGQALHATKVTLSWEPATDNVAVSGYQVYRDGARIADLAAVFNSWMDNAVKPGTTYHYTVKACDMDGNLSPDVAPVEVSTQL
jgi:fibronectin type 3 domain-containing protein